MGSDGSFVVHNGSVGGTGKIFMPSGQGGGCIMSGPFAVSQQCIVVRTTSTKTSSQGAQANLGPINPAMAGMEKVNGTFAYNPRCMRRDLVSLVQYYAHEPN